MKIKVNDQVKIITGKERGKTGKVVQVFPGAQKVVVEGLNKMKRHLRPRAKSERGQVLELAAPLHVSNVLLVCPRCQRATRVGKTLEAGAKKRRCHQCREFID